LKTYTTVSGDKWDIIAHNHYGSSKHVAALIAANIGHKDTFIFSAGVTLVIPDMQTAVTPATLPPWKRVNG
jgi:phage tail protein X